MRALEAVLRRDRAVVIAALSVATLLAWTYTLWLAGNMSVGMGAMPASKASGMGVTSMMAPEFKPWTSADFIFMLAMWAVMMIGMMTPSVAPTVLVYARVGRHAESQGRPLAATSYFVGGYLLAWTAFSLAATVGQWLLERAALLTPMMATSSSKLGGLVLLAAGIFQWTPVKEVCLRNCQSPLVFIQRQGGFRRTALGSLRIGFRHGIYCVGCCWAMMALLFVGGVMNMLWIALLTIFVLLEKVLPVGQVIARVAGAALAAWGTLLLLSVI